MLQRELDVKPIPNPLFIPILGVDGKVFHLQPGEMEILQEMPMMAPARGGILCEELGQFVSSMCIFCTLIRVRHWQDRHDTRAHYGHETPTFVP